MEVRISSAASLFLIAMIGILSDVPCVTAGTQECYFCTTPMECAQPLNKMARVNCKRGCITVFTDQSMTMSTWRTCGSGKMCMNTPRVGNIPAGFMCACEGDLCNTHNGVRDASVISQMLFTLVCFAMIVPHIHTWRWG